MKPKINPLAIISLALILTLLSSCKRTGIEEPSPLGPSTLSVLLKLSANIKVLHAGTTREVTTITANLKKFDGIPLTDKTIHFEIQDELGNSINVGCFEDNETVKRKATDQNGVAQVNYYGPLARELAQNLRIYISATVAGEGKDLITEFLSLDIIRKATDRILELRLQPNMLFAGQTREISKITATLMSISKAPIVNENILFEIHDALGNKVNVGFFEGNNPVKSKTTNQNGVATIDYYGPLTQEIITNTTIYINATAAGDGDLFVSNMLPLQIIRDADELILTLTTQPNAIFAAQTPEVSTVTATLTTAGRSPLANETIHFDIRDQSGNKIHTGYFEGNEPVKSVTTNQNGVATVDYYGPLSHEITDNMTIYIYATLGGEGKNIISDSTPIYIIQEATDFTFELIAEPNVLWATDQSSQSAIKAYLKTADGTPLTGRRIYFKILKGPGHFSDGSKKTYVLTDENGMATITYIGPTKNDIRNDQFVQIQGQPETSTPFYTHEEVTIRIIRGN